MIGKFRNSDQTNRQRAKVAAKIKPSVFVYLVEHDPDDDFRLDALADFGDTVSPLTTFPALCRLARDDPDWKIRVQALLAVELAFANGKLHGLTGKVEQLATQCMSAPREEYLSIRILAYCRTVSAKKILQRVLAGKYDAAEKKLATQGILGELRPGASSSPLH